MNTGSFEHFEAESFSPEGSYESDSFGDGESNLVRQLSAESTAESCYMSEGLDDPAPVRQCTVDTTAATCFHRQVTTETTMSDGLTRTGFGRQVTIDTRGSFCAYGGDCPIVGTTYKLKVAKGFSPLQFLNRLTQSFLKLDEVVFAYDGTLRKQGGERIFPIRGLDLWWRYEAHCNRYVIDFFKDGELLSWRWDEMRPTTDSDPRISGIVPKLICVGHVGNRVFHYTFESDLFDNCQALLSIDSNDRVIDSDSKDRSNSLSMSTYLTALNSATSGLEKISAQMDLFEFDHDSDFERVRSFSDGDKF